MQHKIVHVQYKNNLTAGVTTYGKDGDRESTQTLILERVIIAGKPPEALPDIYARLVYRDGHYEIAELYKVPEKGFQSEQNQGDGVVEEFVNLIVVQRGQ